MYTSRAEPLAGRISQRRLAHSWLAQQARIHRHIAGVDHHPGGQQLPHHFFLTHPANGQFIGMRKMQCDAFNLTVFIRTSAVRLAMRIQ